MKHIYNKKNAVSSVKKPYLRVLFFLAIFSIVGLIVLALTLASTQNQSLELESDQAVLTNDVSRETNTKASGGNFIQFGPEFKGYYQMVGKNFNASLTGSSLVDGVSSRLLWKDIEPRYGQYDWQYIDKAVQAAGGKPVILRIFMGQNDTTGDNDLPDWLFAPHGAMPSAERFIFERTSNTNFKYIPTFWDPTLARDWGNMIKALGQKYSGKKNLIVMVTGPWKVYGEPFLPACNKTDQDNLVNAYKRFSNTTSATVETVRDAYDRYVIDYLYKQFSDSFPGQPLAMAAGLGVCDNVSSITDNSIAGKHPRMKIQFDYARNQYGGFVGRDGKRGFFIQFNGLNGSLDGPSGYSKWIGANYNPISGTVNKGVIGYQMVGGVEGIGGGGQLVTPENFVQAINNAITYNASYIEIQEPVLAAAINNTSATDKTIRNVLDANKPKLQNTR